MKDFSSQEIKDLNAQSSKGKFVEAVIFTRDQSNPSVKDYFVRYGRSVSFQGNLYQPLDMAWLGIKTTATMELPGNQVVVSNLGGKVIDYLEDPSINIESNDVVLQVLHIDKFGKINLIDELLFQVETIIADYHKTATFNLGVNYSLNDIIPRQTIETQEFAGIRQDVVRVGV